MKVVLKILFWLVAVVLVALTILSLDYSFEQALIISIIMIPGAVALRYILPKVSFENRIKGVIDCLYVILGTLTIVSLAVFIINYALLPFESYSKQLSKKAIILNPIFIGLTITAISCTNYLFVKNIDRILKERKRIISITTNYRKETLIVDEIMYIESRDKDVLIVLNDKRQLKNSTPISKWETMLGDPFIRIHRAFLVNKNYIKSRLGKSIIVNGTELPVSRTYADKIKPHLPQNETADEATASM